MAKRRTKKQKIKARESYTLSWGESPESASSSKDVKREKSESEKGITPTRTKSKKAEYTDQVAGLRSIKRDLLKSVFVASLILCVELMIYFFWR